MTAYVEDLADSPEGDGIGEHQALMCRCFGLVRILVRRRFLGFDIRLLFFLCDEFDILSMRTRRPLCGRSGSAHEQGIMVLAFECT